MSSKIGPRPPFPPPAQAGRAPSSAAPAAPVAQTKSWSAPDLVTRARYDFDDVKDRTHDGQLFGASLAPLDSHTPLSAVRGVMPSNGEPVRKKAVFINGIMTDFALNQKNLQVLANTGLEVVGIHNATAGLWHDVGQCLADKLNLSARKNKAVGTAADVIEGLLKDGGSEKVVLIGHSQGALILSSALTEVSKRLKKSGLNNQQIAAQFSRLEVETLGGAAWTFPRGPKLRHIVNEYDPVALLSGAGLELSASNRVMVRMGKMGELKDLPPLQQLELLFARSMDRTVHGLSEVYANARKE